MSGECSKKIMVVEDDRNLSRGICFALEKDGYQAVQAFSLKEAKEKLEDSEISLMLLDLNLPDGDGIIFCGEIVKKIDIPIIMLTARDMETDEVLGLLSGASDYITKPFSLSVLKARVANALRTYAALGCKRKDSEAKEYESQGRLNAGQHEDISEGKNSFRDIEWRKDEMRFYKSGRPLELSITEYRLLSYFFENFGRTVTKEQILSAVWDTDGKYVDENTLPVNISRLRGKLDGKEKEAYIRTVFGVGYCFGGKNYSKE